jgi:hypothetical protein
MRNLEQQQQKNNMTGTVLGGESVGGRRQNERVVGINYD